MNLLRLFINLFHFNRTNWKAVLLCFVTASIFWLFNALNKPYSTNIRFPLQFEFDQNQFAPAGMLPQTLLVNVNGSGWDLFRKYFGVKVPVLTIPLERPAETRKIVASTLTPVLASQMGNIKINHVVVDTVRLQIERRVTKRFKLTIDLSDITYRNGAGRVSPVVVLPDTVQVSGPASIINSLNDTISLKLPARRVTDELREQVEVNIASHEFTKRNPPVVEVRFEVGDVVEVQRNIRINRDNLPWGYAPESDSVLCTFIVPQKMTEQFNKASLSATVAVPDDAALKRGSIASFKPLLHGIPPLIVVASADSVNVKRH